MRDEQMWNTKVRQQNFSKFSPRIAKVLSEISYKPKKIPKVGSYYIGGPIGTGKTILAAQIALEAAKERYLFPEREIGEILFVTVPELLNFVKESYGSNSTSELMEKFSEAYLLVLDDLGAQRSTDWTLDLLYLLINRRYESLKHTIITSNLDLNELAENIGDERIPARIERMCELLEKTGYQ